MTQISLTLILLHFRLVKSQCSQCLKLGIATALQGHLEAKKKKKCVRNRQFIPPAIKKYSLPTLCLAYLLPWSISAHNCWLKLCSTWNLKFSKKLRSGIMYLHPLTIKTSYSSGRYIYVCVTCLQVVAGGRHVTSINGFLLLLQESLSVVPRNLQADV